MFNLHSFFCDARKETTEMCVRVGGGGGWGGWWWCGGEGGGQKCTDVTNSKTG